MNDIRDVKAPIDMLDLWWVWILAVLVVLGISIFFYIRRKPIFTTTPQPVQLPWEVAYARLQSLADKHYPQAGRYKEFYSTLSDIVRHYLEDQLHINAPEMTTEEFLNYVRSSNVIKEQHKTALRDFLNGCDMVKFAKHVPNAADAQVNFDLVRKLIDETKNGI